MGEEKKTRYHTIEDWMLKDPFFNAGARFKIYIIIRSFTLSSKNEKCFYSLSDFEGRTGLRRPVICRTLQELKNDGYISIEKDGQRNYYTSIEKINETSHKSLLVTNSDYSDKKLVTKSDQTSHKKLLDQSQKVTRLVTKSDQHPSCNLVEINLNTTSKEAVNICLLNNTPSQDGQKKVTENDKNEEPETATAERHDGINGNNGYPAPPVENPSLSLTDDGNNSDKADDKATTEETAPETTPAPTPTKDRDREILDRILAERPLEEIVADKLMEIYPPVKVDISRDEVLFRLKNISHLDEETIYILTLVKETMDINPAYVPKLSRYLDQGAYLQHYRVRSPLAKFSADTLAKEEWQAKMTKKDWKEAGELLLRDFDLRGDGFKDPLPEPTEEEKAEAIAWLEGMGSAGNKCEPKFTKPK